MATTSFSSVTTASFLSLAPTNHHHNRHITLSLLSRRCFVVKTLSLKVTSVLTPFQPSPFLVFSTTGNGGDLGGNVGGGGGGGGSGGGGGESGDAGKRNRTEAIMALAEVGRSLDSIPKDLAAAIEAGRIPGSIVNRYFELEKSPVLRWLLNFGGFKERLLADDLFLTKVGIECGVGIFTKTAAELEKRREKFSKELDFVFADVNLEKLEKKVAQCSDRCRWRVAAASDCRTAGDVQRG